MISTVTLTIRGTAALLQHSDRLADPLSPEAKSVAEISHKRSKTDDDLRELSWREWLGSRYTDAAGNPCVLATALRTCLVEGARKFKLGRAVEGGVYFTGETFPVFCEGVKAWPTPRKMFEDPRFFDRRTVGVGPRRVVRTRAKFPVGWGCTFGAEYDSEVIDEAGILQALEIAGRVIGLGDYRPLYGRFEVI